MCGVGEFLVIVNVLLELLFLVEKGLWFFGVMFFLLEVDKDDDVVW